MHRALPQSHNELRKEPPDQMAADRRFTLSVVLFIHCDKQGQDRQNNYAMVCADDNYYLLAYNSERNIIKNYRVDKLAAVEVTGEPRKGKDVFEKYDLKRFTRHSFGMFSGKEVKVTMRFSHRFANAVVDRFGKDVFMRRVDDNWIEVVAPVVVSPLFFSWLYGLGPEAYIVGPQDVKEAMKNHLLEVSKLYE